MPLIGERPALSWLRVLLGIAILTAEAAWFRRAGLWNFEPLGGVADLRRLIAWLFPFLIFSLCVLIPRLGSFLGPPPPRTFSRWLPAAAHLLSFAAFAGITLKLGRSNVETGGGVFLVTVWFILGAASLAALGAASLPDRFLALWDRRVLLSGFAVAVASLVLFPLFQSFWTDGSALSVRGVLLLLRTAGYHVSALDKVVGTDRFSVHIAPSCSGYEGIGLFLAFSIAWLVWFRKEYRFPAALLLLPAGVAISWALNVLRIALLILIGHYGQPAIAVGGFHSQAGWIAFTLLAVGFCAISHRIPGIRAGLPRARAARVRTDDPAAAYLGPFVAIQVAAMVSTATSSGFEWLYPLRVLAPAAVLLWYRRDYARTWLAPRWNGYAAGIGIAVAAVWAFAVWHAAVNPGPAAHLQQLEAPWRVAWWFFRLAGAVVLAPLTEELAFRGYLMRRTRGPEVDKVEPRRAGWLGVALSSLAFGLLHGNRWLEGVVAGLLYGHAYARRGRLGDSILAHALTNAILMAVVLWTGDWRFW